MTTHAVSTAADTNADQIINKPGQTLSGILRIVVGFTFLWAFLDKCFGLGYSTTDGWMFGTGKGNPTAGFLKFGSNPAGPLHDFYVGLAPSSPNAIINWLFMFALAGAGFALVLGIFTRIAAIGGSILLFSMWLAVAPWAKYTGEDGKVVASNNPIVDDHIVSITCLLLIMFVMAGRYWGLGRWWESKVPSFLR